MEISLISILAKKCKPRFWNLLEPVDEGSISQVTLGHAFNCCFFIFIFFKTRHLTIFIVWQMFKTQYSTYTFHGLKTKGNAHPEQFVHLLMAAVTQFLSKNVKHKKYSSTKQSLRLQLERLMLFCFFIKSYFSNKKFGKKQ